MPEVEAGVAIKSIAVVGTRSAARSVAMATLLQSWIERHGWGERLRVGVGGIGLGAGEGSATELGMLARDGYDPIAARCAEVAGNHALLMSADCLVVASGDDAALLLEWPAADGKQVYALTDYLDDTAWAIEEPESGFRDFVDEIEAAMPSLLRALIAWPNA